MVELIWLIPLVPLAGVAINGLLGRKMSLRAVGTVACGVVLVSLLLSVGAVWELSQLAPDDRRPEPSVLATWLPLGSWGDGTTLTIDWAFALDPLSALMILVVTGVGFLIHVYSVGYMSHEPDYARFFVYMNLFMSMMLLLVLGENLLVMFVGWEGVGLCSYLLIGFFYDKPFDARTGTSCADAGRKAFVVNRIGDFAFLIGILYLALNLGTVSFSGIREAVEGGHGLSEPLLIGIGLLLFIGACGKSAQIPLYVWLPDAMAGPTPVSALIHAATMVTAGVYMVCRMSALYVAAPSAMLVIAVVGAGTAIFAATMGLTSTDIKKVLAYSTVSQLGYMFAAAGVGAYTAAMFHLTTHAFFKALLFLGAGSVIHALHGEQDILKMGGLKHKTPVTYWTFLIAATAIAGIFPLAGFFSKDEILWESFGANRAIWALLLAGALLTAFYMFRLVSLVFWGEHRGGDERWSQAHESPRSMTVPLMVLAVLSVVGGWLNIPKVLTFGKDWTFLHHWLEPSLSVPHADAAHGAAAHGGGEAAHSAGLELGLMGLSLGLAVVGLVVAIRLYRSLDAARRLAAAFGPLYRLVRNLYWVDELYELAVLRPFYATSRAFRVTDERVIDGGVHLVRNTTLGLSTLSDLYDRWIVDGVVNLSAYSIRGMSAVFRRLQTGRVQTYVAAMVLGIFVLIVFYTVAR